MSLRLATVERQRQASQIAPLLKTRRLPVVTSKLKSRQLNALRVSSTPLVQPYPDSRGLPTSSTIAA
eukprot:COSAG02_NODE_1745_length_11097_cov_12.346518_11_plen_67_part_00